MTYAYVAAAILLRLAPHPWNATPLGSMFLFSGATFKSRTASLLVPLGALMLSDLAVVQLRDNANFFNTSGGDSVNPVFNGIGKRRLEVGLKLIF